MNSLPRLANPPSAEELSDLLKLEEVIANGLHGFFEVGIALSDVRDRRLYRKDYGSFNEYVEQRWGIGKSRAYQLIDSVNIAKNLSTIVDVSKLTEGQIRPLSGLEPAKQIEAYTEAGSEAGASGKKVTAKMVEKAARKHRETADAEERPHVTQPVEILTDDDKWKDAFGGVVSKVDQKPEHPLAEVLRCEITNLEQLLADVLAGKCDLEELADVITHRKQLDKALREFQKEQCK